MAKGLGKGLAALISDKNLYNTRGSDNDSGSETRSFLRRDEGNDDHAGYSKQSRLDIKDIKPGRFQPRVNFDESELNELADSIRANGIIQPIIVRGAGDSGYEIIAGERRWRAAGIAGMKHVPVIIMDIDDRKAMEVALIENIQRSDLNVIEEAEGYKRLINEFKYTQKDLGAVIGKSRSNIANTMRLLELPDNIKNYLCSETITAGHARALLMLKNPDEAAEEIIRKNLNVRQAERLVKRILSKPLTAKEARDSDHKPPEIAQLEKELSAKTGVRISIKGNGETGRITIDYGNAGELDKILGLF